MSVHRFPNIRVCGQSTNYPGKTCGLFPGHPGQHHPDDEMTALAARSMAPGAEMFEVVGEAIYDAATDTLEPAPGPQGWSSFAEFYDDTVVPFIAQTHDLDPSNEAAFWATAIDLLKQVASWSPDKIGGTERSNQS